MRQLPNACILFLAAVVAGSVGSPAACAAGSGVRPSTGCGATAIERGRELHRTIDVNGTRRDYILDVSDRVQAQHPVPLVFDFHGFGYSAARLWRVSRFKELAARDGFITVYPEGLSVSLMGHTGAGWEIYSTEGNRDLALVTKRI